MFSSYQISNPSANAANTNRKSTPAPTTNRSSVSNIPRRRDAISTRQSPSKEARVASKEPISSSSISTNLNNDINQTILNDPKLKKKCTVIIERSEAVKNHEKAEVEFINQLLEKQREMQRQRALKRDQVRGSNKTQQSEKTLSNPEVTAIEDNGKQSEIINVNGDGTLNTKEPSIRRHVVRKVKNAQRHQKEREKERQKQKPPKKEKELEILLRKDKSIENRTERKSEKSNANETQRTIASKSSAGCTQSEEISTALEYEWNAISALHKENKTDQPKARPSSNSKTIDTQSKIAEPIRLATPLPGQVRSRVEVRQCMVDAKSDDPSFTMPVFNNLTKPPTRHLTVRLKRTKLNNIVSNNVKTAAETKSSFVIETEPKSSRKTPEPKENCKMSQLDICSKIRDRVKYVKQCLKVNLTRVNEKYRSDVTEISEQVNNTPKRKDTNNVTSKKIDKRINQKVYKSRMHQTNQKSQGKNTKLGSRKVVRYYTKYKKNINGQLQKEKQNVVPQNVVPQNIVPQNVVTQNVVLQNVDPQNVIPQNDVQEQLEIERPPPEEQELEIQSHKIDESQGDNNESMECDELSEESVRSIELTEYAEEACVKKAAKSTTRDSECQSDIIMGENIERICASNEIPKEVNSSVSPTPRPEEEIEISKEMAAAATSLTMLANKKAAMTMTLTITSRVLENETGEAILSTAIGLPSQTATESGSSISMRKEPITMIGEAASAAAAKYSNFDATVVSSHQSTSEEEDTSSDQLPLSQQVRTVTDLKNIVEATTVNVIKDATMTLLSFEATATLPTYLFNGESRDVPTPTQALICTAAPPTNAFPPPPSGAAETRISSDPITAQPNNKDRAQNTLCDISADSSAIGDKIVLSTSDHEVSSTQETLYETTKRSANSQPKTADISGSGDTSTMVQNNQIDTTHHFPESPYCARRRLRKFSDEFSHNQYEKDSINKKRRKTICSESMMRVQFTPDTPDTLIDDNNSALPTTTTITGKKTRRKGRLPKCSDQSPTSNITSRSVLKKSASAMSPINTYELDNPELGSSNIKSSTIFTESNARKRGRPRKIIDQLPPPNISTRSGLRKPISNIPPPSIFEFECGPEMDIVSVIPPVSLESIKPYSKESLNQKLFVSPLIKHCGKGKESIAQVETTTCELQEDDMSRVRISLSHMKPSKTSKVDVTSNACTSSKAVRLKTIQSNHILSSYANEITTVKNQPLKKGIRTASRKRK